MKKFISALATLAIALTIAAPQGFSKEGKKSEPGKPKATQGSKKQAPKSDKEKGGIQYSPPQPKKEQAKKPYLKYCADVVYVEGDLRAKRAFDERWFKARENMPDYLYDHLKTDSKSVATVQFRNGSQVGINMATEILIESETSAKDVTERSLPKKITLRAGVLWAKLTKMEAEEHLQFHTQGGVIGVKGTELIIDQSQERTRVDVLEGAADYARGDKTTDMPAGTTVETKVGEEPKKSWKDPEELRKEREKEYENLARAVSAGKSILAYARSFGLRGAEGVQKVLNYAEDLVTCLKDPDAYLKSRAMAEVQSRVPFGGFLGGLVKEEAPPPPPEPVLEAPRGEVKTYLPTFKWRCLNKPPQQYRIIVSLTNTPEAIKSGGGSKLNLVWETVTSGTSATYPAQERPLRPGLTYYWIVIPENVKDGNPVVAGKPSQTASFFLASEQSMAEEPRRDFPVGDVTPGGKDLIFDWTAFAGAAQYRIRISEQQDLGNPVVDQKLPYNYYMMENWETANLKLSRSKTYYWQIEALDEAGNPTANTGSSNSFKIK